MNFPAHPMAAQPDLDPGLSEATLTRSFESYWGAVLSADPLSSDVLVSWGICLVCMSAWGTCSVSSTFAYSSIDFLSESGVSPLRFSKQSTK